MPRVTGRRAAFERLKNIGGPEKVRAVSKVLFEAGQVIKAEAQHSITAGSISGRNHVPSAPGKPPNEDTGFLRSNINVTQPGPLRVRVSSDAPYSQFLEFGTSRMAARPFMGPAARNSADHVTMLVREAVDKVTRR